jgi:hypothetical protein
MGCRADAAQGPGGRLTRLGIARAISHAVEKLMCRLRNPRLRRARTRCTITIDAMEPRDERPRFRARSARLTPPPAAGRRSRAGPSDPTARRRSAAGLPAAAVAGEPAQPIPRRTQRALPARARGPRPHGWAAARCRGGRGRSPPRQRSLWARAAATGAAAVGGVSAASGAWLAASRAAGPDRSRLRADHDSETGNRFSEKSMREKSNSPSGCRAS